MESPPLSASAKIISTDNPNYKPPAELYPFGDKGYLYLSGLGRSSQVEVRWRGGKCLLNLLVPSATGRDEIPELGIQVCKEQ
jgi:outer membrane usher protein FimD/PapC